MKEDEDTGSFANRIMCYRKKELWMIVEVLDVDMYGVLDVVVPEILCCCCA